jgi:phosphoribosylglycinamide formyltransferase 1
MREAARIYRLGILISGRGSNMVALIDAAQSGMIPQAEVAVVISDQPAAPGLAKAKERGIETLVVERSGRSREEHDHDIMAALRDRNIDLICLAGYMRILSNEFIEAFRGRILNIHPSLLPSFPGLEPQQQALDTGVDFSGCTVHFVDETLDGGPIIAQRVVPVLEGDTVEKLSARILEQEHQLYPEAVALILQRLARVTSARGGNLDSANTEFDTAVDMEELVKPTRVEARPNYRIYLEFSDGAKGEVDLSHFVGKGVFAAWNDLKFFEGVHIGLHREIKWNDEIELCPDSVYLMLTGKSVEEVFPGLAKQQSHA